MKLRLLMLGKTRREEARALVDDYTARIRHYADVEVTELRDAGPAALRKLKLDSSATIVLLDAAGNNSPRSNLQNGSATCATAARANSSSSAAMPKASRLTCALPPNKKSRSPLLPCPTNSPA